MGLLNLLKPKPEVPSTELEFESVKQRLEAVIEINQVLVGVIDTDKVFQLVTSRLVSVLGVSFASIWQWDPIRQTLFLQSVNAPQTALRFAENILGISLKQVHFDANDPKAKDNMTLNSLLTGKVLETDNYYDVGRPYSDERMSKAFQLFLQMKKAINVPLIVGEEKLGVISIIWKKDEVTEADRRMISTFANLVSTTIYNAQLFNRAQNQLTQLEQQNRDISSLFNLSSQIGKSLDPKTVAQTAVDSLPQNDFMTGGIITEFNEKENTAYVIASTRNPLSEQATKLIGDFSKYKTNLNDENAQQSPVIRAIKEGNMAYSNDLKDIINPLPRAMANLVSRVVKIRSVVSYPIRARGKIVGSVSYFLKDAKYEDLEENQKQLLATYSLQIGIAMENANLYDNSQTIQKQLQTALSQLQEARRAERDMMDVMGHELRTPISIVRNSLAILNKQIDKKKEELPISDVDKYVDMALESTRREINLIETLLSATKVDASRMQIYLSKVDLLDVINDGIEGQRDAVSKKNLKVNYIQPSEPITVYTDRTRIQEIMDNIYSNAVKYTLQGDVYITVWKNREFAFLSIRDTGMGISPDDLQNLGKKFFRAKQYIPNPEVKDGAPVEESIVRPGGTGLGLYVIYDLIRIMGCTLYINSEMGKGSNFTVKIPLYTGQPDKQTDQTFLGREEHTTDHIVLNEKAPEPE